jgi:F-type H+-transporting ATPase subunit delta
VAAEGTGTSGIADRYATALFELARDSSAIDGTAADLDRLHAMIDESADLRRLLRSPIFSREQQTRAVEAILERAGVSALTRRFVGVVARNRRLFALEAMIGAFRALLAQYRGEITAQVTTAAPLSQRQREMLEDALKSVLGAKVAIDARTDPALLGGMVVRVGSRMVDSSLKSKLDRLQLAMKGAA